jgi:prepilin-type N-terminal cleavage/methylation domain-containing protein
MRASRNSNFALRSRRLSRRCRGGRGFTLIELIFVLVILAITAVFVSTSMARFFRGRALNFEARRLLSLTHYGQSRAVSEGVPVVLWINPANSTYGLSLQSTYTFNDQPDGDRLAVTYTSDPTVSLEIGTGGAQPGMSEQDDERLGMPEGVSYIRFNPDGFFDETSAVKIFLRQANEEGLELVQTRNRLGYEIRPASNVD